MRAEEGDVDSEGVEPQFGLGQAYPELGGNANNSWRGKGLGEFARMAEFRKNRRTLRSRAGKNAGPVRFLQPVDCFQSQGLGRMFRVIAGVFYVGRKIRRKFCPRAVESVPWTSQLVHLSLSGRN